MSSRSGEYRSGVFLCTLILLLLPFVGCATPFTNDLFEKYEFEIGAGDSQTVLAGFLLGGTTAEVAVVTGDRQLRIYGQQGDQWVVEQEAKLDPSAQFVDIARINGRDRLITYARGGLYWFDPDSSTEQLFVTSPCKIDELPPDRVPHVDITRSVNGDEHDDLVIPIDTGFSLFVQTADGSFADPITINCSSESVYDPVRARYDPWSYSGVHDVDYDSDSRDDLVAWNNGRFEVYRQSEAGLFGAAPETFTTEVAFDSADPSTLVAPHGVRRRRKDHNPDGNLTGRVLHSMRDQNGDGVADLGVFALLGESLWGMHSRYDVHFGEATPEGN